MEKLRENEKINEKVKSQGRPQYIDVNVPGGILRATACIDPNYPGIDIEFIPDKNGNPEALSLPRILLKSQWRTKNFVRSSGAMRCKKIRPLRLISFKIRINGVHT